MKLSKKLILIIILILVAISISTRTLAAIPKYGEEYKNQASLNYTKVFADVPKSYWAFDYIMEMVNRGVLSGYPNGNFYPNNTITRAEFSKIMCIASGLTVSQIEYTSYKDVTANSWYAPYVEAGKHYLSGYISDGEKYYLPESNALREDIAVALVKLKGYDTSLYDESILKTMFTDWQSISQGARKYVSVAVEKGLISGYDDNTFRGQNSVTRAEAATLLWRAYQYGNENKVFDKEEFEVPSKPIVKPEIVYPEEDTVDNNIESPNIKEPQPKYLYELKTVGTGVKEVVSMIATNDGAFYLYDNNIYEVSKDGNSVELLIDRNNLVYFGKDELTKYEKENMRTYVTHIGYDPISNERYCIIQQIPGYETQVLYNLDTKEYVDITELMNSDKLMNGPTISYFPRGQKFILDEYGNILSGKIIIDYNNDVIRMIDIDTRYGGNLSQLYVDNDIYTVKKNSSLSILKYDKRTCSALDSFDYYIGSTSNDTIIGSDNNYFYFKFDNKIFKVDSNGEIESTFCDEDIDNIDGKKINIGNIKYETSAISPDGVIYYWDIDYNCIRQLNHK